MIWFDYNSAIPGKLYVITTNQDLTVHIVFHHRIQYFKKNQLQGKSKVKIVDYKYLMQYFSFLILDNKIVSIQKSTILAFVRYTNTNKQRSLDVR